MSSSDNYNTYNRIVYQILDRFYNTYQTRRHIGPNPNGKPTPLINKIHNIELYIRKCTYSRENKNEIKTHLVIKINNYPRETEKYILSVPLEDYKDLLHSYS